VLHEGATGDIMAEEPDQALVEQTDLAKSGDLK
jgi:hypothetical protein